MSEKSNGISRRSFFKKSSAATAAVAAGSLVTNADLDSISANVNTNSKPSDLKITDMRLARFGNWQQYVLRLDTNQGITGYGELHAGSSKNYALTLKSRILGMNPCNVDQIFRKIKQFGGVSRQGAGVSSVEMACWDLAGKAWGVPVWQMLGGKFRDKVLIYADTDGSLDPEVMAGRLKERMDTGFKFLKMDLPVARLLRDIEGTMTAPPGMIESSNIAHPFTGMTITDKGLKIVQEYCATVRDIIGWEIPVATDHYGHFVIESCIKLARALDQFNFAWLEDMVPWQLTDQYVRLKNSCETPILTGEDIHLKEGFMDLFEKKAISICHPDTGPIGGIFETKKVGDLAQEHGIAMAIHNAGLPPMNFASVHAAAATENFMCLEHHHIEDAEDWYDDLYANIEKPLVKDGYINVPDGPGLGFEFNEEALRKVLIEEEGWFLPTPEWDNEQSHDRLWSLDPGQKRSASV
jgi:L-alanine-DL-glutamate epimerase-like enolase superfamily enzyme